MIVAIMRPCGAAHRDDRYAPGFELLQRVQEIESAAPGGDPAIEGGVLSQLNSLGSTGGNPLILFEPAPYRTGNLGQSAMPRRRVLTDEQLRDLLALPVTETLLIQHWTLSPADLAIAFHAATLATGRALPLTRTGLSSAGTRQLRLAHRYSFTV
jgi:hypothetical protein